MEGVFFWVDLHNKKSKVVSVSKLTYLLRKNCICGQMIPTAQLLSSSFVAVSVGLSELLELTEIFRKTHFHCMNHILNWCLFQILLPLKIVSKSKMK